MGTNCTAERLKAVELLDELLRLLEGNETTRWRRGIKQEGGKEGSHMVRMVVLRGFDIIMASASIPRHVPWSCMQNDSHPPGDQSYMLSTHEE